MYSSNLHEPSGYLRAAHALVQEIETLRSDEREGVAGSRVVFGFSLFV